MSLTKIAKNAFANLARGGISAVVALIIPPFLTKILSKDVYSTWLLIVQLSAYVSFLDFSIQLGVGRFVAHYTELGDFNRRNGIVNTAFALLSTLSIIGIISIFGLAWWLPHFFKDIPSTLQQDAQLSLLLIGFSIAICLPFSVFTSVFIGLDRYDIPAWIIGSTKVLSGVSIVLIANTSHDIIAMAIVVAMSNFLTGICLFIAQSRLADKILVSVLLVSKEFAFEIIDYCLGLSIWTIGLILVSGLDIAIIGFFDYSSLIYYSLAITITSLVTGIQSTVISVIMPTAAAMGSRQNKEELGNLLIASTRYGTILIVLTSLPIFIFGNWIVSLWVGADYATSVVPILVLLVLGNSIRSIGLPYATIVASVGEQKLIFISPLIEGTVNLLVSIMLVKQMGITGVAIGTIVGALISVLTHFTYNLSRTKSIYIDNNWNIWNAVLRPLIITIPSILMFVYFTIRNEGLGACNILVASVVLLVTIGTLLRFELLPSERKWVLAIFKKNTSRAR
jgi:O-antigen/teichoic acid export membrane protein